MSLDPDEPEDFDPRVRAQYEAYAFPRRDPKDETHRLVVCEQEALAKLNHYCYAGRQTFDAGFRVLVAGGGTGDHTIFLAEQLRDRDASVTYVDISEASMGIARARAAARGLDNIEWHHCSILDLPRVEVIGEEEPFWEDYEALADQIPIRGNLVPDAHLAVILREHGVNRLYTSDTDFRKFDFLEVIDPCSDGP